MFTPQYLYICDIFVRSKFVQLHFLLPWTIFGKLRVIMIIIIIIICFKVVLISMLCVPFAVVFHDYKVKLPETS